MNTLIYKGYLGGFTYDGDADIFHGEVLHLRDVITFQGRSIDELKTALAESVEDYLTFCREQGKQPEKPYSGRLNLRLDPDLHRRAASAASQAGQSLNAYLVGCLEHRLR